jgi:hypothetical protein
MSRHTRLPTSDLPLLTTRPDGLRTSALIDRVSQRTSSRRWPPVMA